MELASEIEVAISVYCTPGFSEVGGIEYKGEARHEGYGTDEGKDDLYGTFTLRRFPYMEYASDELELESGYVTNFDIWDAETPDGEFMDPALRSYSESKGLPISDIWYLENINVPEQYRGRGVGILMLRSLIEFAKIHSHRRPVLCLYSAVRLPSEDTFAAPVLIDGPHEFYRKAGFRQVGGYPRVFVKLL